MRGASRYLGFLRTDAETRSSGGKYSKPLEKNSGLPRARAELIFNTPTRTGNGVGSLLG